MNSKQWAEIVEWVADRFPESQWHAEQAVAYFFDLEDFDAADVWAAVFGIYEQGITYAPTGSQLLAASVQERRAQAERERYDNAALPEPAKDAVTWKEYTVLTYGKERTANDVIRDLHEKRFPDCRSPLCDVHRQEGGDDDAV